MNPRQPQPVSLWQARADLDAAGGYNSYPHIASYRRADWLVRPGLLVPTGDGDERSAVIAVVRDVVYMRTAFNPPKIKRSRILRKLPAMRRLGYPGGFGKQVRRYPVYETPWWSSIGGVLAECAGVFEYEAAPLPMTAAEAEYIEAAGSRGLAFLSRPVIVKWKQSSKEKEV